MGRINRGTTQITLIVSLIHFNGFEPTSTTQSNYTYNEHAHLITFRKSNYG